MPSRKIAEQLITDQPTKIKETLTGCPRSNVFGKSLIETTGLMVHSNQRRM